MESVEDNGFSLTRIREIDMVGYLASLGYQPVGIKKNGTDYWYLSPLRTESEASFHVNQITNEWYDFPLTSGGNMIDFCLKYHQCGIRDLLEKFNANLGSKHLPLFDPSLHEGRSVKESKLIVTEVMPIYAYPLKIYLHERAIPVALADQYCKEIHYQIGGNSFYGIGFKNDSGGYEIRNKNYKQTSAPKDITTLHYPSSVVNVFEGFMDFLSYQAVHPPMAKDRSGFVILNGAGMIERALPYLDKFERVGLWLDRDVTGQAYTQYATSRNKRYQDESSLYAKFKDLNDWLMHKGEVPKAALTPGNRIHMGGP